MNFSNFLLLAGGILLVATKYSLANVLPADLEKCNYEDSKCIKERIEVISNKYAKTGLRSLNLVPFDPLHINRLKLAKNPTSPVAINLEFKDVDLLGLMTGTVTSVSGFDEKAKKVMEIKAHVPQLILKGQYEVDGKVLILPIVGKGASEVILENMDISIRFKGKLLPKADGQKYLEITGLQLLIDPKKVTFNMQGLFGKNKELGDNMLVFINENWQDIFKELQPDIQEALGKVFKALLNNVFGKAPYSEYFLASSN